MKPGATVESVMARLMALSSPALWRRADLSRALSRAEKTHLEGALTRLQADGRIVALTHGKSQFFAFADPLRERLAVPAAPEDLMAVYRRLVRESGGFPDVKISLLARALGFPLSAQLTALWRTGDATLSLGDWSLASEETRAAAVELNGEKYLLVRFEVG